MYSLNQPLLNQYGPAPWGMANQYPNPWFNVANQFTPRNLKDLIRWVKYITLQSPTVTEVLRKFSTYPLTDFQFETTSTETKKSYEGIFKSIKLKEALQNIGFQYWTLGNVFVSLYFPVTRTLKCPSCGYTAPAKGANWAAYRNYKFVGTCPKCQTRSEFEVMDYKSTAVKDLNIILWDPADISTEHNPITGETNYYYVIPKEIRSEIQKGNRLYVDTVPMQVIEAVKKNQDFLFDPKNFFHLKNISTGGSVDGIAIPPLLSLFPLVFYQATLRRANEAVALEYLAPLRIVSPASSGSTDPVMAMSMGKFKERLEAAFRMHKQDPNYVMVSPLPISYQLAGGEGKTLLVSQEIQQAEQQMLLSLGVSQELLSGTTNWTSSHVGLRMLENTLGHYTTRINEIIEWVVSKIASYMNLDEIKVELTPVKLLDDDSFREVLGNLYGSKDVSKQTLFETLGLSVREEADKIVKEAGLQASIAVRSQIEADVATFLSARKALEEISGGDEYQAALREATQIASQISQMSPEDQDNALATLKIDKYPTWLLVQNVLQNSTSQQPTEPQQPTDSQQNDNDAGNNQNPQGN